MNKFRNLIVLVSFASAITLSFFDVIIAPAVTLAEEYLVYSQIIHSDPEKGE